MSTSLGWTPPRLLAVCVALSCFVSSLAAVEAADDELFGLTKIHQLRLTLDAKEHAAMEPTQGGFPGMGGGPGGPGGGPGAGPGARPGGPGAGPGAAPSTAPGPGGGPGAGGGPGVAPGARPGAIQGGGPGGAAPQGRPGPPARPMGAPPPGMTPEDMGAGRFNFDFKYVHAALEIDGKSYADVGVRYKGNGTYLMSMRSAKRSLKIDFDRFDEKQSFRGAKKLNLNSGPMDPTKAREVLAYWLFSKAGLPAPRTALAEVTLNVPGKFDGEFLGVYTIVEQVDKKFLKRHFGDASGLLLKPEGLRGLPHLGDDLALYEKPYNVKEGGGEEQWKRLHLLTRLVSKADEVEFRRDIEQVLDVDAFLRFLAMNTLLASFDGYIGLGHNYYLYLSPETNKFVFFPWDLDLSFGTFPMFGSPDQQVDLSINHPHVGDNKLIDRLLAVPAWKESYHRHLRRMTDELFTADELGRRVTEVETALKDLLPRDKAAAEKRRETGGFGFGPPGGGGFGATPITLTAYVQRRADSVTRQLDGKHQGYVPQGGFGMPGGGGGPPPLGRVLTRPALQLGDADRDGKLSSAEFNAAAAELFKKWDANGDGQLSEQELDAGITSLVPNTQRPGR